MHDIWNYPEGTDYVTGDTATGALVGYKVEAVDGSIGKVDETTNETGASFMVVDTGPWIFGKKVLVPAGVISKVDHAEKQVNVDRTKDEIKDSPHFGDDRFREDSFRQDIGAYYGPIEREGTDKYLADR